MEDNKIIEFLNRDLQDEHGAIIQYLNHAYAIGEGELACEIEAIARDEMRHFDWLAEIIVELGGVPSLERGAMRTGGKVVAEWMHNDVLLEEDAIKHYHERIEMTDNPKIERLLRRILADEQSHHRDFQYFIEKSKRESVKDIRGSRKDDVSKTLNWGIAHEYTVILQYMFHSYMTENPEAKKQFEDQAINEMQHLGWLAEELVDGGGSPVMEHTEPDRSDVTTEMLKADIKIEKEVAAAYGRAAREKEDKRLKELLIRIRDNEYYHIDVFNDLLQDEETRKEAKSVINIPDSGG
jgi:bacterioferritin